MKDAYDLLKLPDKIEKQILQRQYEIDGLRSRLLPGSMDYGKEKVQNAISDKMPEIMGRIDEMEREIAGLEKKKEKAIKNIKKAAEKLTENQKTVIIGIYIAHKSVKQIAKDMGYSTQRIYQYWNQAVKFLN